MTGQYCMTTGEGRETGIGRGNPVGQPLYSNMAETLQWFSTLVQNDHPDVLGALSSEGYAQSTEHLRSSGRVGVLGENLLALLSGRRENVKRALRVGVSPDVRKTLWISLASFTKAGSVYRGALGDVSQDSREPLPLEAYGWLHGTDHHCLPQRAGGHAARGRVLETLHSTHRRISHCPLLPPLVALTSNFLEEAECYCLLDEVLSQPGWVCQDQRENLASINTLAAMTRGKCKHACQVLAKHKPVGTSLDRLLSMVFSNWREWIFLHQPFWFMVRVLDMFFEEGSKVLYRLAVTCLVLYTEGLLEDAQSVNVETGLEEFVRSMSWEVRGAWFKRSLTLSVTRSSLKQLWFSELAKLPPPTPRAGRASNAPPSSGALQPAVTLTVSPAMLSCLVGDEGAWRQLWAWLPEWSQIKHPNMVFRATSNGYNLNSLYHKAGDRSPLILLVKTNKNEVFGAFIASDLAQRHKSKGQFFGTGESFLFTLRPTAACHKWTGESSFFLLAQDGELVVGGGGGSFGLWLDGDLHRGSSSPCQTFGNPPLVSSGQFTMVEVEVFVCQDTPPLD